jgi:FKBP-type peptidyl-prolyl cis-trans isomerase FkpA
MAEVTRVPIKPISRGSLVMLFLGILIGLAMAGAFAWYTAPKGVSVEVVRAGTGDHPTVSDLVFVHYTGKLEDGTEFDKSQPFALPIPGILPEGTPLQLEGTVPGFREAVLQMQRGGKYTVEIPAEKAYGATPPPGSPIPPNADLVFEVELVDFMPLAEAERRVQMMQAAMQQQGQAGAGPNGGAAGPAPAQPPQAPAPQAAPPAGAQ